jgi:hypothetical protein
MNSIYHRKQLLPDLNNTVISQERFLGVHKGFWRAYAGLRCVTIFDENLMKKLLELVAFYL